MRILGDLHSFFVWKRWEPITQVTALFWAILLGLLFWAFAGDGAFDGDPHPGWRVLLDLGATLVLPYLFAIFWLYMAQRRYRRRFVPKVFAIPAALVIYVLGVVLFAMVSDVTERMEQNILVSKCVHNPEGTYCRSQRDRPRLAFDRLPASSRDRILERSKQGAKDGPQ